MIQENQIALAVQPWGVAAADPRHRASDHGHRAGRRRHRPGRCRHRPWARRTSERPSRHLRSVGRRTCASRSMPPATTSSIDVSFAIAPGEVLGLVGESGSGKTTVGPRAARSRPARRRTSRAASVLIGDFDILGMDEDERRDVRGRPGLVRPAGSGRVAQPGAAHRHPAARDARGPRLRSSGDERRDRVAEMMREVALPDDAELPAALPARALRRPAAARRPGDGVRLPAPADRPRRADHRPRRHHAGARARDGPRPGRRPTAPPRSTSATTSRSSRTLARASR